MACRRVKRGTERFTSSDGSTGQDYPHWDSMWPNTVKAFMKRDDVSEVDKRLILGENAQRFYGFTADV